jgi:hypothetical protein
MFPLNSAQRRKETKSAKCGIAFIVIRASDLIRISGIRTSDFPRRGFVADQIKHGIVYLVGAGPGDPGLITARGVELLRRAEVVVYDYLSNPQLLVHAPQAQAIYVGKKAAAHSFTQEQINALLVEQGSAGKRVVRLKGGDPFVFGRGSVPQRIVAAGVSGDIPCSINRAQMRGSAFTPM